MKKIPNLFTWMLCAGCAFTMQAQETKRAMTFDDLAGWNRISEKAISADGKWVSCKIEPWVGDPAVQVYNRAGKEIASFEPAENSCFTSSGNFLLVTEKPGKEWLDSLKLKKVKKENLPKNKLIVYSPLSGNKQVVDSLLKYKVPEWGDWIAYQRDTQDSALYVLHPADSVRAVFPSVTDFRFSKEGNTLLYAIRTGKNAGAVYTFNPQDGKQASLYAGEGEIKMTAISRAGDKAAFIVSDRPDSTRLPAYSLWLSVNGKPAEKIAADGNAAFPENWIINEYTEPFFSENGERLYFATFPRPLQKDTTVLDEYFPNVHIWNWKEEKQYTQQRVDKEKDARKGYLATYDLDNKKIAQLATTEIPEITLKEEGNAPAAIAFTNRPYALESMWEGRTRYDIYTLDLKTGNKILLKKGANARMEVSPEGKFGYWYNPQDSSWYTCSLDTKKEIRLSSPHWFKAYDEDNDVPGFPQPYGIAGWTENDRYLLVYDKYDIWQFDPAGIAKPVNLTVNGRSQYKTYRLIPLDKEAKFIDTRKAQLLSMFDHTTKGSGYYSSKLARASAPKELLAGSFMLKTPVKAKNADVVIYTAETFENFPDLRIADLEFKKSLRLTDANPQQENVKWGTAELVRWNSLNGIPLEGVVYKPADFDPAKKYPLIVNFYERNSDTYHAYRQPEPHRSTIDYHFYNSNGYIVFNPDVRYIDGHPGLSAYNCIIPGIEMLLEKGYIDRNRIGAQGHSWGGYQVADLATRTGLFAAIESGAPVVNMFSAYGGIRWGTGLNRSFQYEHGQSRIGKTPWEAPELYKENSPLFNMDKVKTPILIMANDNDGHVPWYQGIEYFIALKRLQKPVWLLNYTGEPHWPMRMANRIDFQKRMFQFFQHYLNNQPAPAWMKEGVPATRQEYTLGYE